MHYYKDPHPYFDMDVLIMGAKNSAVDCGAGVVAARVARDHGASRAGEFTRNVKYWIKPDIENRIKNGEVTAYFNSCVWRSAGRRAHQDAGRRAAPEK